ncbi:MAG: glycosyltransferase family 4 protein [Patescibacteria group bacterium]
MKVAIVHDYLHQYGGAEKVVEKWLEMYPEADIYTSIYTPNKFKSSELITRAGQENRIYTSFAQLFIPKIIRFFKHFFWLYPIAMSLVKVRNYDLVLISSTYCGKNVQIQNCGKIIHYCHSPVRFLYGLITETDHKTINPILRHGIPLFTFWLRWMDMKAAQYLLKKGCIWVANSNYIKGVVKRIYGIDAITIYPPAEIQKYLGVERNPDHQEPFYFFMGRITFHKKVDMVIQACLELGRKVLISGAFSFDGDRLVFEKIISDYVSQHPEADGLVKFLGRVPDEDLHRYLSKCQAYIFPGREDFGIAQIEMLAAGIPLVEYGAGGALEYSIEGINSIMFEKQNLDSLKDAILRFEQKKDWDYKQIKETARPFASEVFVQKISEIVA